MEIQKELLATLHAALLVALAVAPLGCNAPITAKLATGEGGHGFATFDNRLHPDNVIGYRFHEHTPFPHGEVPASNEEAGIDPKEIARLEKTYSRRPGVLKYSTRIKKKTWAPQTWTFRMAPVEDGIDILLVVETGDIGLNAYYGVQQCFRMSGTTNEEWRRKIARTPAFSEFDLWNLREKDKPAKTSLTSVRREGKWQRIPAAEVTIGGTTPLGLRLAGEHADWDVEKAMAVGPYEVHMGGPVDCGLITRTDIDQTWVCGIFWDRTSHVTDHHPADCLHNVVNIGGIPANGKRAIRGKIYWFQGTLDDLMRRWKRDFPDRPHT